MKNVCRALKYSQNAISYNYKIFSRKVKDKQNRGPGKLAEKGAFGARNLALNPLNSPEKDGFLLKGENR
jgi:hypothetical protein